MKRLTTSDEFRSAEAAARRVFRSFDASRPFRERMEARMLLYPINYTMLTVEQFRALAEAATAVGDDTAYVVPYAVADASWESTYDHGVVELHAFSDYSPEGTLILEHLLYSPQGRWGLVTSDGGDALLGGSQAFIEAVGEALPEGEEARMVKTFVRDSQYLGRSGGDIDWLHPVLAHLYGETKAHELRDEVNGTNAASRL